MKLRVLKNVLEANESWARQNRNLLRETRAVMLNLIGSPGSGKTALLEKTIERLKGVISIGVIEGDLATAKDARRIQREGVPARQINTGSGCHLNAHQVHRALSAFPKGSPPGLLFVENVGNLVCPAEFDLGEEAKVAVLSVTEGDDKVEKYPLLFRKVRVLVITKMDLLRHTDFDLETATRAFRKLNRKALLLTVDSLSGRGFSGWIDYLRDLYRANSK